MNIILMADVINSSDKNGKSLMEGFKQVVEEVNKANKPAILSPLTITLGDEFQGVIKDLESAVHIVFDLETRLMSLKKPFKLRYVIHEGKIDTPINKANAYGMLGPGLTDARKLLESMKSSRQRYIISLARSKEKEFQLNTIFSVLQGIADNWTPAQQKVAAEFLELGDYKKVAEKLKKDPTSLWRRKKTLLIDEFLKVKKMIEWTIEGKWQLQSK